MFFFEGIYKQVFLYEEEKFYNFFFAIFFIKSTTRTPSHCDHRDEDDRRDASFGLLGVRDDKYIRHLMIVAGY